MFPYPIFFGMSLYDILLAVAVVLALLFADKMAIRCGFSVKLQKVLIISVMEALVVAFVGAILSQAVYNAIETGEFVINQTTGMTFYGGLIFGVIGFLASWFFLGKAMCKSDEPVLKFGAMADIAACLVPFAHAIGRLGCYTAGCCHGAETDAWYGVKMYTESGWMKVVPVQLYEAIFLFALSAVLCWFFFEKFEKQKMERFPLLPIYVFFYAIWRFFIEYARADDRGATFVEFLSPSQLIAVLMAIGAVVYFFLWRKWKKEGKLVEPSKAEANVETKENPVETKEE